MNAGKRRRKKETNFLESNLFFQRGGLVGELVGELVGGKMGGVKEMGGVEDAVQSVQLLP